MLIATDISMCKNINGTDAFAFRQECLFGDKLEAKTTQKSKSH